MLVHRFFCCPTWIRTKTNRTKICRTTIILSGSLANSFIRWGCKNKAGNHFPQMHFNIFSIDSPKNTNYAPF